MQPQNLNILGIKITRNISSDIVRWISDYLKQTKVGHPWMIVTPNPELIVEAQKDEKFRQILNTADIALPDGIGIVWASRVLEQAADSRQQTAGSGQQAVIEKRIAGVEFMEELVKLAAQKGYPVGFIGGRGGVAAKSLTTLKAKYSGLTGWAEDGPEIQIQNSHPKDGQPWAEELRIKDGNEEEYFTKLAGKFRKSKTRLVFIGLGAPKQEYFMQAVSCQLSAACCPLVLMSVGGAFDTFSGRIPRAPDIFQRLGLEWLWRLLREPWRLSRQIKLIKFVFLVIKARIRDKIAKRV